MSDLVEELRQAAAYRRTVAPRTSALLDRAADEIARLRELVAKAHVFEAFGPHMSYGELVAVAHCRTCDWRELVSATDPNGSPRTDAAKAAHAAHVAAILEGRTS